MGGSTMWIILGVLIAVLIIFFAYSSIKDRKKKNQIVREKIILNNNTILEVKKVIFDLKALIEVNQKYLNEFQPSIGQYKMNDIVTTAKAFLDKYSSDELFQKCVVTNPDENKLYNSFALLYNNRSKNWYSKCSESLDYINKRFESYDMSIYQSEYDQAFNKINDFYLKEFAK